MTNNLEMIGTHIGGVESQREVLLLLKDTLVTLREMPTASSEGELTG